MKTLFKHSTEIRVAAIGYGGCYNMGRMHLSEMQRAGMVPVAVVELNSERLEAARADFPGIETYRTVEEFLEQSSANLVAVITPHASHAPIGLEVLGSGRHCILEKPMALTTAECDRLIAAAEARGLLLSTYHNRHWDGPILDAMELLSAGELGTVVRVDVQIGLHKRPSDAWRSSKSISGGALYDYGVHLLESAFQVIRAPMMEVVGYAFDGFWKSQPDCRWGADLIEDEAQACVRCEGGQRINLIVTSVDAAPGQFFMKIVGTRATHLMELTRSETHFPSQTGEVTVRRKVARPAESHRFYENIAAHLVRGEPLVITPQWARRPIHVLELATRSAQLGKALQVTYR